MKSLKEEAETLQKIRSSLQAWHNNPTRENADAYVKNVRNTTNIKLAKASDALGTVANLLDVADGVAKGLEKAAERGYVGDDRVLRLSLLAAGNVAGAFLPSEAPFLRI